MWPQELVQERISTHDLARRSTIGVSDIFRKHFYFNSRPRKEVDKEGAAPLNSIQISTHDLARRSTTPCFLQVSCTSISTHDLARRSTHWTKHQIDFLVISTHDLARRSTASTPKSDVNRLFQLTTSQGGRPGRSSSFTSAPYFNSRPRKEVDHNPPMISRHIVLFQLTTSQGGRPS